MDDGGQIRDFCNITMNAVRNQLPVTDVAHIAHRLVTMGCVTSRAKALIVCAGLSFVFISKDMIE